MHLSLFSLSYKYLLNYQRLYSNFKKSKYIVKFPNFKLNFLEKKHRMKQFYFDLFLHEKLLFFS